MEAGFRLLRGGEAVMAITMAVMITTVGLMLSQCAPARPMLDNPVEQGLLKTDIMSHFFALNPLMTENLRPLGQKFLIEC